MSWCVTHGVVVTLEEDACGVVALLATPVSVQVNDADRAVRRHLGAGLDVAQVHPHPPDGPTRPQQAD